MIIVFAPVLVMIIGLLMYALSTNAKILEIGKIMFAFGLLATLLRPDALKLMISGGS